MTILGEAFIAIRPQAKSFEADLQKEVVPGAQRVAKTLATSIGGAFVAGKIKDFVREGIQGLNDAAVVTAQTAAAIKSTGGAANVSADQVAKLATEQHKLAGVDDELIQKGANLLLTFTGVRNEVGKGNDIFNQATTAALDLSRAGFGSIESASVLMGKALNDPVQGLTALQRVGVRLTDDQKELVKELVATGDTLGAQKVILEEVTRQVGGSAEAYGKTLPGQLQIAQTSMDTMRESMVSGMVPALKIGAEATTFLTEQFAKQPQALQAVEGGLLLVVGGLASVITPLKSGIDLWRSFGAGAQVAASSAGTVGGAVLNSASSVDTLFTKTTRLSQIGFAGMAVSAKNLVVQLGLLAGAIALTNDAADRASLPKLSQDILNFADNGNVGSEFAATFGDNLDKLGRSVERIAAPSGLTQVENVIDAFGRALGDTDDDLSNARAHVDDLDKALANIATQDPDTAAAALKSITDAMDPKTAARLVGLLNDYDDAVASAGVSSKIAAGQIGSTGDAAGGAAGNLDALADATVEWTDSQGKTVVVSEKVASALDEQKEAMDALLGITKSAITADLDYRDAQDATADTLANLTQLTRDGKGSTDEYRRAVDDAARVLLAQAEAASDTAVAQYELAGQTLGAKEQARIQKEELIRLAETLAPNSPLRRELQGMIDKLAQVESKHVEVTATTAQAQDQLDKLIAKLGIVQGQAVALSGYGILYGIPKGGALGGRIPQDLKPLYRAWGGPTGTDTIPMWASPGEFMMQKSAVDRLGVGLLSALNNGAPISAPSQAQAMADGFTVGQLVVQGATVEGAYATASEVTRQLRAEHFRLTGVT